MNINIEYFKHVLEVRERELKDGPGFWQNCQVYCVFEIEANHAMGHQFDVSLCSSKRKGRNVYGYFLPGDQGFCRADDPHLEGYPEEALEEATEFYSDKLVAVFLTHEDAIQYVNEHEFDDCFVHVLPNHNKQFFKIFS